MRLLHFGQLGLSVAPNRASSLKKIEHDGDSATSCSKGNRYPLFNYCLAAFFGRRGLFCILRETEVCQKTTDVPSGSVATIAEDTGAADSHRNLRGNVQRYGGVQRMLKRGDVEQSAASHRLELRIVKFTNHDDFLQRGCM